VPKIPSPTTLQALTDAVFGFAGCIVALVGECITVSLYNQSGNTNTGIAAAAVFFLFFHIGWYVVL
jgi:hypothetical protein